MNERTNERNGTLYPGYLDLVLERVSMVGWGRPMRVGENEL